MIRPITCVGFILACASGFHLYQAKHRVDVINHQIANVVHETDVTRGQIRFLVAEWALLNQPDRLQKLADQFSSLEPTDPSQFTSLESLDSRLPPLTPQSSSPDVVSVAGAAVSSEPAPVLSTDIVAQNAPGLIEAAEVPPPTDSPAPLPPEASPVPPPSLISDTAGPRESPPFAAPGATQPATPDAVAASSSVELGQHEAEAAGKQLLQAQKVQGPSPTRSPVPFPPETIPVPPASPAFVTTRPSAPARPAATAAIKPSGQDAEAAHLSAQLGQLEQQHEAETARNRLLQAEADRLATQIEQRQRSLEALHALAQPAKQTPPAPAPLRPAAAAGTQPSKQEAGLLAAELAQLEQQHEAEAATNRRLQAEVDRLASQIEQQQKSVEARSLKQVAAKQAPLAPAGAATPPTLGSFNTVQNIIARLRHEQTRTREPPPQALQPAAPIPSAPAVVASRPQPRFSSPWLELMRARAALGAGDTYLSRQRLEAAKAALLSQPSRRHFFAADQISIAIGMINAGLSLPAFHFLDLAIANAGDSVPYAADNMPPPGPYPPPWAFSW